jgi:hypothetical protein
VSISNPFDKVLFLSPNGMLQSLPGSAVAITPDGASSKVLFCSRHRLTKRLSQSLPPAFPDVRATWEQHADQQLDLMTP